MKVMMICVMDNVDIFHEIKIFNLGLQDYITTTTHFPKLIPGSFPHLLSLSHGQGESCSQF